MIWRLISTANPRQPPDLVYDAYLLALQSHLELWLGILAANLPALAPLMRNFRGIQWSSYLLKFGSGNSRSEGSSVAISVKTFGRSSGNTGPKRPNRSDFGPLEDSRGEVAGGIGSIVRNQDFEVSVV
jgi:hypothetical protein